MTLCQPHTRTKLGGGVLITSPQTDVPCPVGLVDTLAMMTEGRQQGIQTGLGGVGLAVPTTFQNPAVTFDGVQCNGIKLDEDLTLSDWFVQPLSSRWSNEIGLCPFFDMLNHNEYPNADWDFDSATGSVWVRGSADAMVSSFQSNLSVQFCFGTLISIIMGKST